jgi:uncharacterized RDD family membrane protein YckC
MGELSARLVLASSLSRLIAFFIATVSVVLVVLAMTGLGLAGFTDDGRPRDGQTIALMLVTQAAYHGAYLIWRSATPGKMALRIYVAYPDGAKVRPDTAILRTLVLVVESAVPFGTIVSGLVMLLDGEKRSIHDRIAGTVVLRGRPEAPLRERTENDEQQA